MGAGFRAAAVTVGPAGRFEALLAEAEAGVRRAAGDGADLVLLPELFALPYVCADDPARWDDLAEAIDGPTARWAAALAHGLGLHLLFGTVLAGEDALPLNAALLARPDGSVERLAAKIHLPPRDPADRFGEADHFAPGPAAVRTLLVGSVRLAALVCYDRRFPECWRAAAAAGADLVAVLVAGPASGDPEGMFLAELRTHARANAVYALAAARTGVETVLGRPVRHDGLSAGVDPEGRILGGGLDDRLGRPAEPVIIDLDPDLLATCRAGNPTARRCRLTG
jgi:N-carbamoylputrescine amidase